MAPDPERLARANVTITRMAPTLADVVVYNNPELEYYTGGRDSMRTRSWVVLVGMFVLVFVLAKAARAENMQTAGSLSAGHMALGLEFQAGLVSGTPLVLNLHEMVGLASGVDLCARQGIGLSSQPFYIGAGLKWTFLTSRHDRPGLALLAGGHYFVNEYGGADTTLLIDYTINTITGFLGMDINLDFPDGVDFKLGLYGGVRFALVRNVAWFIETGVGLTGNPKPHFISTGPKITL